MSVHDPEGSSVCIHAVCVSPEHRRKGIALALLELPRGLVLAASRRRRPWDGDRLARWLDRHRLPVAVLSPSCAAPSRSR